MNKQQSIQRFVSSLIDGELSQEGQSLLMSGIGGRNDSIPENTQKKNKNEKSQSAFFRTNKERDTCTAQDNSRCINVSPACSGAIKRFTNKVCQNVEYEWQATM